MTQSHGRADLVLQSPGTQLQRLMHMAAVQPPLRTAVVHPVDVLSLSGAIAAARRGLIEPVLIGPVGRIEAAAAEAEIALGDFEMIDTVHSHQAAAMASNLSAPSPPLAGPARSLNARASAGKRRKAE